MLKKAVQQTFGKQALFPRLAQRTFITFPDKNYKQPESLQEVIQHLDKTRPTFTLLYFTAKWNPICKQIEKDYENTCNQFQQFEHIRVDCDSTPTVKFYFDARVEPQFLVLLNGGELRRVVGYNFVKLQDILQQTTELHQRDFQYYGDTGNSWERFYDSYDRWARSGEYDKDAFRLFYEPISDQHRGAGTQNP
eukprot:403373710